MNKLWRKERALFYGCVGTFLSAVRAATLSEVSIRDSVIQIVFGALQNVGALKFYGLWMASLSNGTVLAVQVAFLMFLPLKVLFLNGF